MNSIHYAVAQLQDSKQKLLAEIENLSEEQLVYKPSPDKWNIAEVMEHITLVEIGIGQLVQQTIKASPDASMRSEIQVSDEQIREMLTNRTSSMPSSDAIKPMGRFPTITIAKNAFIESRDGNLFFIQNTTEDLRTRYWRHPVTGTIDLYQTLLLISAHCERHIMQIVEIKCSSGFPVNG